MTEEECVENLRIQKDFVQVLAPGGSGQVSCFHYRPQREGNVFTGVCLFTIRLVATGSLLVLVVARSVRILLECCLVCICKLSKVFDHL